jgi:ABC-type Fe3+/spermidine/putrescine transport system ATPase subunit
MNPVAALPSPLALNIEGLAVELGGRPVLQDIALQLQRGQTLALLGPSGCGKTTLLRSIAGLVAARVGEVHIAGRAVAGLPPQARGVGMMFQSYALFPNLNVRDNIAFGPLAQGWTVARSAARTEELLALVELREHGHKHPAQLSGGQRQRVALARALAPQPALLLMDEPYSALDEAFRVPLRRAFRALQQALSQSCVLVTHDREEAFELADHVAVMLDGRIARIATPAGLLRHPGTLAVAQFLGTFNVFQQLPAGLLAAPEARNGAHSLHAAPIRSLQVATAAVPAAWCFEAQVVARHVGLSSTQVTLRHDDGSPLSLIEGREPIAVGDRLRLAQALADLVPLDEPGSA